MADRQAERDRAVREKQLERHRRDYKPIEWNSKRPRPHLDSTIWSDRETADKLAVYIDWHARHPHMVSPRARGEIQVERGKDIQIATPRTQKSWAHASTGIVIKTEEEILEEKRLEEEREFLGEAPDPASLLAYYGNGVVVPDLDSEFQAPRLGENGQTSKVAKLAEKFQREVTNIAVVDNGDAWYKTSVKDGLEIYHIDGDHTSVRLKKKKAAVKSKAALEFEAAAKWREEQYGKYKGGAPTYTIEQQVLLDKLAIANPNSKVEKKIVGPWEDPHEYSIFTKEGTLLDDFNRVDLDRKITDALRIHEELLEADKMRRLREKRERMAIKRATQAKTPPSRPGSRPLSQQQQPRKASSSRIHPMSGELVPINEDSSIADDTSIQTRDMSVTFGGASVSSIGGNTFDSLVGDEVSIVDAGGSSVQSGSTYMHRKHNVPSLGPLDMSDGASQQGVYKPAGVVDEATIQGALTAADDDSATIMTAQSQLTTNTKETNKKKKKKGGGDDEKNEESNDDDNTVTTADTKSTKKSLISYFNPMTFFRKHEESEAKVDAEALENMRKKKKSEELLSDSEEEKEEFELDKYDVMRAKLGGDEKLEKVADAWLKFAQLVRKKSKRQTNMFDSSMDLPDAVDKNNLSKVVFLLAVMGADPDSKGNNEEPLVINVVHKILTQDTLTNSLNDPDNESPDRKKAFRTLQALIKFGVTIDTLEAKNGIPPLHMAVQSQNLKMVTYLIDSGADPDLLDRKGISPLMCAAKSGQIQMMAHILRKGGILGVVDGAGKTALHYAGMFGQTRAAMFLLRCGLDKRTKDNNKMTAGAVAEEAGYIVTGQAIMTYATLQYQALFALQYFVDQEEKANQPSNALENLADSAMAGLTSGLKLASQGMDKLKGIGSKIMGWFGLSKKKENQVSMDDI